MWCIQVGSVGSTAWDICQDVGWGGQGQILLCVSQRTWQMSWWNSHPKWSVVPLLIFSRDRAPLEQCGSAAPLSKFHHSSQSPSSDTLFLKGFGKSWTSLQEGPPHCLHRGQGQTHESGLWFRDWNLNNLEEFALGVLVLPIVATWFYFLYIDEIFEQYKSQWIKKYMTQFGAKNMGFWFFECSLSPRLCCMILRRQGPLFLGREMIITGTERGYVRYCNERAKVMVHGKQVM